jgi:hypothetical protein
VKRSIIWGAPNRLRSATKIWQAGEELFPYDGFQAAAVQTRKKPSLLPKTRLSVTGPPPMANIHRQHAHQFDSLCGIGDVEFPSRVQSPVTQ